MTVARRVITIGASLLASCTLALALLAGTAGATVHYGSLSFVDQTHGWAAGYTDTTGMTDVWRSVDGGKTWQRVGSSPAAGGGIGWVAFVSPTTGLWCNGTLMHTTDSGESWDPAGSSGMGYYVDADFATDDRAWAARVNGSSEAGGGVARTDDGGASWTSQLERPGPDGSGGFWRISAPSTAYCYALKQGRKGGVYATADAGASWKRRILPSYSAGRRYSDLDFPLARTGWVVGAAGRILKTTNGGSTWATQRSLCTSELASVDFVDAKMGYVAGAGGRVLRTVDGGRHWVRLKTGTAKRLATISFVDRLHGWVAGQGGVLLRTTDGGTTWSGRR